MKKKVINIKRQSCNKLLSVMLGIRNERRENGMNLYYFPPPLSSKYDLITICIFTFLELL